MGTIAPQITSLTIVFSTVYSGADQSKHQSAASLAFVWGIHRAPVNSPHKWPVTRKMFPFDDVIMHICVPNGKDLAITKPIFLDIQEQYILQISANIVSINNTPLVLTYRICNANVWWDSDNKGLMQTPSDRHPVIIICGMLPHWNCKENFWLMNSRQYILVKSNFRGVIRTNHLLAGQITAQIFWQQPFHRTAHMVLVIVMAEPQRNTIALISPLFGLSYLCQDCIYSVLTQWGTDNMADIWQTTLPNIFTWKVQYHQSLFPNL